jgi:hypothetical protein
MDVFASNSTRAASIEKEPGCDSRLSAMRTLRKRRSCRRRRSSSCTESSRDRRPGLGGQIPGCPRCDLILGLQILVRGYRLRQNPRRGNRVLKHDRGSHLRPSSPRGRLQTRRHHEPTLHGWGALERRQAAQPQQSSIFYPSCCNGESSRPGPSLRKQPELPKLRGLRNDGLGFSSLRQGCSKRPGEPRCDINASH